MTPPSDRPEPSFNGRRPDAREIQARMDELRRGMRVEVSEVSQRAKQVVDWRYYVRRFPLATAGAAVLAGYLLVPASKQIVRPSDEQLERLAHAGRLHLYASSRDAKQRTATSRALLMLGTMAARAAMAYVGKRVGEAAEGGAAPSPGEATP